jgi:CelD/BcsL family acetyltransferase involved in cellulose biosynthesis
MTLSTEILRDAEALARIEPAWWDLWRRAGDSTPFATPAWLLPWWRTFRPGDLATLAVRDGAALVALAPAYREDGPWGRRLLPLGIGLTDYTDVLLDPARPDAAAALAEAAMRLEGWDAWSLEELPPDAALRLPAPGGLANRVEPRSACPVLPLGGSLAGTVPGGKLRKLRMARNRAARREGFSVETVGADGIPAFLDVLFDLHGARWATRGEGGVLEDEAVRRFHQAAAPALVATGLARFAVMRLEGRVVGAYYGLGDRTRAYAYLGGFDPAHAFESPGTILVGHAIEAAIGEGAREFHFLRGQEPYKYEWGARDRHSLRRTLLREPAHA